MTRFFHNLYRDYFDNAASTRDFRSQLRGNRVVLMWTTYLLILTVVALVAYAAATDSSTYSSIPEIQASMQGYYRGMMVSLAVAITIIAPVLTASSMADERIRQSLELVITSPVDARYLLVGKILSSMRFTAVLIFLALPAASVGVVLGGATWLEVFVHSLLIMISAGVLAAIGIVVGLTSVVPRMAVITALSFAVLYQVCFLFVSMVLGASRIFGGTGVGDEPWILSMSPFVSIFRPITSTTVAGIAVPNVLIAGIATALIVGLIILNTAATLSSYCSKDVRKFRIVSIVLAFVLPPMFVQGLSGSLGPLASPRASFGATTAGPSAWVVATGIFHFLAAIYVLSIPVYFVVTRFGDRKYRFDEWFNIKKLFLHVPSSSFPFGLAIYLAGFFSLFVTQWIATRTTKDLALFPLAGAYWLAFLWLLFAYSRLTSRRELWDFRNAKRRIQSIPVIALGVIIAVIGAIVAILTANDPTGKYSFLFKIHPMYPIFEPDTMYSLGLIWTVVFAALGYRIHRRNVKEFAVPPKFK